MGGSDADSQGVRAVSRHHAQRFMDLESENSLPSRIFPLRCCRHAAELRASTHTPREPAYAQTSFTMDRRFRSRGMAEETSIITDGRPRSIAALQKPTSVQ